MYEGKVKSCRPNKKMALLLIKILFGDICHKNEYQGSPWLAKQFYL